MSDDPEVQQEELWRSAAKHVVPWGKLQRDDYDFQSWATNEKLIAAGCAYEYARESHKFRCLLALHSRPREECSVTLPLIKFQGDSAGFVYLLESGWKRWLEDFADELIGNKSFAELLRTRESKVNELLVALPSYSLFPKAVELPGRYVNRPGSQDLLIQVCWRHYTNKEIGEEMERLAGKLRPNSEKEPQRKGKGKESTTTHWLDALSAMRLASWYPISPPRRGLSSIRGALTALDRFNNIRLGGSRPVDQSNFYSYTREARRLVEAHFFGEQADNAKSWTEREGVRK